MKNFHSINPADGSIVWQGKFATTTEIQDAYNEALLAFRSWATISFEARVEYARQFGVEVASRRHELETLISEETGKPRWESATEVDSVINKIELSIKAYLERCGETTTEQLDAVGHVRYKPHGVVAVFGAFNFPAHLSNGHIIPAMLAGNTILYKPSTLAPGVADLIMQCWHASNLPAGIIHCLQGDASVGQQILKQPINAVYFTGSYKTGVEINKIFASQPEVLLALEMGGNNPLLIEQVEDLQAAVYNTLLSTMISAGQRCTCARRLLIPSNAWGDKFLENYVTLCQKIKIGAYTEDPQPFMGPVIRHSHALDHIAKQNALKALGGKTLLDMQSLIPETGFLSPGIMDMTKVTNPPDEEIFAPFVQVFRYNTFDEALQIAANTKYGLVAGIVTEDQTKYKKFYTTIKAGVVNWNKPTTGAASNLPFGGVGHSGNNRPSAYFAADYCAHPIASLEQAVLRLPPKIMPGIEL